MPKRTDLHSILIIGSGPIVIGQGCEFDYSGVQACRALREEGYRVVLINSNPATIMTDPEFADATYIEPITPEAVEKILIREKQMGTPVDAVLPTLGGQTGLNTALACFDGGIFTRHNVEMIGANRDAIFKGEDRQTFKNLMLEIGLNVPMSGVAKSMDDAREIVKQIGLPAIIRPAFTLGGTGGGIAYNLDEYEDIITRALDASPIRETLVEQSVLGWKEFELEVVRDKADNCIVVCAIENIDPMGVHTGDSVTVAPTQTLTDKEYQKMRDAAFLVIRAVGVETGGSNIQFGVNPANGDMVVIEMNPRVSRSSALASKATGYPIAKIAAKLAVGYTLDELPNPITSRRAPDGKWELHTSACFEPTIDYVVVKMPRWTFEKFPDADETLTTQMKSVGEAMAIGRTFKEAFQKVIRSMEVKRFGFGLDANDKWLAAQSKTAATDADSKWPIPDDKLRRKLAIPSQGRLYYVRYAFKMGWTIEQVHELTKIDPWFLAEMKELVEFGDLLQKQGKRIDDHEFATFSSTWDPITRTGTPPTGQADNLVILNKAKQLGFSDVQLGNILPDGTDHYAQDFRDLRDGYKVHPSYKLVDTCAAEFEAATPYYYSSYETPFLERAATVRERFDGTSVDPGSAGDSIDATYASNRSLTVAARSEDEIRLTTKPKVIIIGGGPNRIGQGIEFDYCCVHAAFAMRELGYESVMINSNPETVSTDYDTSDLLFFEPLTHEDILNICERLNGGPFKTNVERGSSNVEASQQSTVHNPQSGLVKGVIVQLGGQTPLNLARGLSEAGVPIIGTSVDSLDAAGDREQFRDLLKKLRLKQPANGIARNVADAKRIASEIGFPVLVRPSFVLGGRAMEIVYDDAGLDRYMREAIDASTLQDKPILIDKFLDHADECDLDCLADYDEAGNGRSIVIGVMEHIEEAGIHSGDSACVLPPYTFSADLVKRLKDQAHQLAKALKVRGLMNVQFAVRDDEIFVIEVNPRASRTVPFVGKATGIPWAKIAAKVMAGKTLDELNIIEQPDPKHVSVKEVVFPFAKFPGVDVILGPEMRSTGEVMGIDVDFPRAFAKAQLAAGTILPTKGKVFISLADIDKPDVAEVASHFHRLGFELIATGGTFDAIRKAGVPATRIPKLAEGRPNVIDMMKNKELKLIINTPTKKGGGTDEGKIRATAVLQKVPMLTTLTAAQAAARAIESLQKGDWTVKSLQAYHGV